MFGIISKSCKRGDSLLSDEEKDFEVTTTSSTFSIISESKKI